MSIDNLNILDIPPPPILDRAWTEDHYAFYCPTNYNVTDFTDYIQFFKEDCRIPICSMIYKKNVTSDKIMEDFELYKIYDKIKKSNKINKNFLNENIINDTIKYFKEKYKIT